MLACEPFSEQTKSVVNSRKQALSWAHCCLHQILSLAVLVTTAHLLLRAKLSHLPVDDFVRRKSFSEKPPISNWRACSFNPQNSVRCFFKFEYLCLFIFVARNPATVEFDCDFFAFSEKKNSLSLLWFHPWLIRLDRMNKQRGWNNA